MFNFKLKTVAKQFYNNKYIKTTWKSDVKDGSESIDYAKSYYKTKEQNILKSLKEYNLVDCKVMKEIYNYLAK